MFEWFEQELVQIKTHKFHLVDGPASPELRSAIELSGTNLPPSYMEFVLRFGNALLYRDGNIYFVKVFAGPREAETADGESLIHFGRTHTSLAYFKGALLSKGQESPVFEWRHPQKRVTQVASGFDEWLEKKCGWARRQFTTTEWRQIEKGPPPFTASELAVVEARRKFFWKLRGIAKSGDLIFEVYNGSAMVLPYLSIGLRDKRKATEDKTLDGGAWLPVSSIRPGRTKKVEKSCDNAMLPPEMIEPVSLPDPGPEDRKQYWEFRAIHTT